MTTSTETQQNTDVQQIVTDPEAARHAMAALADLLKRCELERRRMNQTLEAVNADAGETTDEVESETLIFPTMPSPSAATLSIAAEREPSDVERWLDSRLDQLKRLETALDARENRFNQLEDRLRDLLATLTRKVDHARDSRTGLETIREQFAEQLRQMNKKVAETQVGFEAALKDREARQARAVEASIQGCEARHREQIVALERRLADADAKASVKVEQLIKDADARLRDRVLEAEAISRARVGTHAAEQVEAVVARVTAASNELDRIVSNHRERIGEQMETAIAEAVQRIESTGTAQADQLREVIQNAEAARLSLGEIIDAGESRVEVIRETCGEAIEKAQEQAEQVWGKIQDAGQEQIQQMSRRSVEIVERAANSLSSAETRVEALAQRLRQETETQLQAFRDRAGGFKTRVTAIVEPIESRFADLAAELDRAAESARQAVQDAQRQACEQLAVTAAASEERVLQANESLHTAIDDGEQKLRERAAICWQDFDASLKSISDRVAAASTRVKQDADQAEHRIGSIAQQASERIESQASSVDQRIQQAAAEANEGAQAAITLLRESAEVDLKELIKSRQAQMDEAVEGVVARVASASDRLEHRAVEAEQRINSVADDTLTRVAQATTQLDEATEGARRHVQESADHLRDQFNRIIVPTEARVDAAAKQLEQTAREWTDKTRSECDALTTRLEDVRQRADSAADRVCTSATELEGLAGRAEQVVDKCRDELNAVQQQVLVRGRADADEIRIELNQVVAGARRALEGQIEQVADLAELAVRPVFQKIESMHADFARAMGEAKADMSDHLACLAAEAQTAFAPIEDRMIDLDERLDVMSKSITEAGETHRTATETHQATVDAGLAEIRELSQRLVESSHSRLAGFETRIKEQIENGRARIQRFAEQVCEEARQSMGPLEGQVTSFEQRIADTLNEARRSIEAQIARARAEAEAIVAPVRRQLILLDRRAQQEVDLRLPDRDLPSAGLSLAPLPAAPAVAARPAPVITPPSDQVGEEAGDDLLRRAMGEFAENPKTPG